jgi:hypothetical protein
MTVVARTFLSIPRRSAVATWAAICEVLNPGKTESTALEFATVGGIAASLITREAMTSPIVVYGSGPRLRIYCAYHDDALDSDNASEDSVSFDPTAGNWKMSLPCPAEDLTWVQTALNKKSSRISARDMAKDFEEGDGSTTTQKSHAIEINPEAFFRS